MFKTVLSRRAGLALLAATAALAAAPAGADESVEVLFVQSAPDVAMTDTELRLKNASPLTLFFSDRPKRLAGHYKLDEWQKAWNDGADSMKADPPNAVLSVFEPGKTDPTETAVELTSFKTEGADLVYGIKLLKGTPPAATGPASLFIDGMPMSAFAQLEQRSCYEHGMCETY